MQNLGKSIVRETVDAKNGVRGAYSYSKCYGHDALFITGYVKWKCTFLENET